MPTPSAPGRPEFTVAGPSTLRIAWVIPDIEPEVTASTVKLRITGSQKYQNYDHATGFLVHKGGSTVPAPTCEVLVDGCEDGLGYEAVIAMMNSDGWGDVSEPSEPAMLGEPKPRAPPPAPAPPKLVALAPGKFRCSWAIPRAFPPVEASQVQLTELVVGKKMLVDAGNGKLVTGGRTTFAATRFEVNINGVEDSVEYVAAICCRNAEGFGEYSLPSDEAVSGSDPRVQSTGMELVLHTGPVSEAPLLEPMGAGAGKMKVRWRLPEDAKSTTVKLRRVGDPNWYLCGGTAIPAPDCKTVALGLEEGIEYEATVAFLVNGRWCDESPVSKPACIGDLKLPGIPGTPKEPRLFVVDANRNHMRVRWQTFTVVPPLTGISVKFRALGARSWQYVSSATNRLVPQEPDPVPFPALEVDVVGLQPGIRYETEVAFRNKLGQGPYSQLSEPVCLGRPIPKLVKCTYCFVDFDLQHAEYTKSADCFWCPMCRFRHMDPYNALVEPYGLLVCHTVMRGKIVFPLDLPDLKLWRKEDHSVFMRMVKIDSDNCAQVWPRSCVLTANGHEVFSIKEPEEGHIRRDVPKNISAGLRPGMNQISIQMTDEHLPGFAMALVRTQSRTAAQIGQETTLIDEEQALARVQTLLADTWSTPVDNEEEEEITCVISNKLKLRCPLSFERVVIPVRGDQCQHLQCFGLGAYLESNMKMRALNNRWTCPVCGNGLKPHDLRIDGYVERVLSETPPHIEEVLILQDGSYRVIEELVPEKAASVRDREAEAAAAAAAVAAEDGEVQELPTTIDDGDAAQKRKDPPTPLRPHLTKRQRRRQKLLTVGNESEEDSDLG